MIMQSVKDCDDRGIESLGPYRRGPHSRTGEPRQTSQRQLYLSDSSHHSLDSEMSTVLFPLHRILFPLYSSQCLLHILHTSKYMSLLHRDFSESPHWALHPCNMLPW